MKVVYVLTDWYDHKNIHAFRQRRNAIQYAYEQCQAVNAFLRVSQWDSSRGKWQYQNLSDAIGDGDAVDYLNTLSDEGINDIFYEYYILTEVDIEDIED